MAGTDSAVKQLKVDELDMLVTIPDPSEVHFTMRMLEAAQERRVLVTDGSGRPITVPARPITGAQAALFLAMGCAFTTAMLA